MPAHDLFLDLSARPVLGHRGASGLRPENTLAAFLLARDLGADGIECDIRLSADGVPVVHHDPTLDRTTNRRGPLDRLTARELAAVDAGGGEGVPTAEAVLEALGDLPVMFELKEARAARPLLAVIQRCGAAGRVAIASFQRAALEPLRDTGIPLGACQPEIARSVAGALLGWPPGRVPWRFYAVPDRYRDALPVPTRRFVTRARRQGCPVHVWTVDDPALATRLWGLGVSGIITNRPDLILAARGPVRTS